VGFSVFQSLGVRVPKQVEEAEMGTKPSTHGHGGESRPTQ
jgi:hypothetical protein